MASFRKLTVVSFIATFVLVVVGALVRSTDSGLGCSDDWPGCNGRLIPDFTRAQVVIEFSHRVLAGIVALLIAAIAVVALRHHRDRPLILWPSFVALGAVLFQAWLGRVVVKEELEATIVAAHLASAMVLFAILAYLLLAAIAAERGALAPTNRSLARTGAFAAAGVFLLLVVGSYLSGFGDAALVPGWPLMNGRLVPNLAFEAHAVHFLHRVLAAVVGVMVFAVGIAAIRRKSEMPLQAKLAHAAVGLYAVEILVGAANVWTQLSPIAVTTHLAVGALIWVSLVALVLVSAPGIAWTATSARRARAEPALGGGNR